MQQEMSNMQQEMSNTQQEMSNTQQQMSNMQQEMNAFRKTINRMNTERGLMYQGEVNKIDISESNTHDASRSTVFFEEQWNLLQQNLSSRMTNLLGTYIDEHDGDVYLVERELTPRLRFVETQIDLAPGKQQRMVEWALKYPKMDRIPMNAEKWRNTV